MLHQPLRGLDGFSARASLQNRRKCKRYMVIPMFKIKLIVTTLLILISSVASSGEVNSYQDDIIGVWKRNISMGHVDRRLIWEFEIKIDGTGSFYESDRAIKKDGTFDEIRTSTVSLKWTLENGIITAWDSSKKFEDIDKESMIRYSIVEINDEKAIFTWPGKTHKYEFHKIM